jgi:AMMECR1 domain-containing protein
MNLINKISKMDGIEDYVLLSRESIERLVEGSKRLDDKSQKIIIQLEKWIYENDMIEGPFDNFEL